MYIVALIAQPLGFSSHKKATKNMLKVAQKQKILNTDTL